MTTNDNLPTFRRVASAALLWLAFVGSSVAAAPIEVPTIQLDDQSIAANFELDGVIDAVKQSVISAQIAGRIASLDVKAGERVRSGQLLLTIDDREVIAGVQRAQAQLAQADAELRNARVNLDRTRQLQSEGFVSKAALDTADTQFKAALGGRDQASAAVRQASLAKEFSRVTAPYDGYVSDTMAQAGDLAAPGRPLLNLYAPAPLRAVVHVPVTQSAAAADGGKVEVLVPDAQGTPHWVTPSDRQILSAADPIAQTVDWRLDLPSGELQALVPGQQVRVRFTGSAAKRPMLPASAILHRGELTAVYVVGGSGFVLKVVRLGQDFGADGIEVLAGVSAGDRVAIDPIKAGLAGARPAAASAASGSTKR